MEKTNALRILDKEKIEYKTYSYGDFVNGKEVAEAIGKEENSLFKTLVLTSKSRKNYVFMVPVSSELDLKKAAKTVNEKSVELIKQKELLPLTGYVHGGCSPIGMKKTFPTFIDESCKNFENIICSGGRIGLQIELSLDDLLFIASIKIADIAINK